MNSGPHTITFVKKTVVPLADNERVSAWEDVGGSITRRGDAITLRGTWRVSAAINVIGGGLLGAMLIRPFFVKDREETIPLQLLERVVLRKGGPEKSFISFRTEREG